ncbi:Ras-related protein RABA5c [Platanthera guangdongensis]|uniref:Ras-related protein RABA5c n=1 Tax=Platanthera guangdongensis TaxID=2320717 RepID=A0ABR2LLQ6_9ASPA
MKWSANGLIGQTTQTAESATGLADSLWRIAGLACGLGQHAPWVETGRLDFSNRGCGSLVAHSDTTVVKMLVGNKCDLENIRAVSIDEGKSLAEAEGLFFMETSALNSTNVKTAFEIVIKEIYSNISRKTLNSDSYKGELSANRVTLSSNGADGSKQEPSRFSCC